jgi:carbon-monoxide dehydrogenase medium subunit/xanthine dehydrogenase FAD-binding subunit
MQRFEFYSAQSIQDALCYLSERGDQCKVIAGGTDLIPALRNEDLRPAYVLNILEIDGLRGIRESEEEVWIGPATPFTDMVESDVLNRYFPSLVAAAASVGGPQIRNRGTLGGNIANASPAADVLPAALALESELELQSLHRRRLMGLEKAIEAPYRTCFGKDELLTGIVIRKLKPGTRSAFEKLGRRNAMARARMNLSLILQQDKHGTISHIRIVPGAVMPVAQQMKKAEEALLGKRPNGALIEEASGRLADEMTEVTGHRWSADYKVPVLRNIFRRILMQMLTS